MTNREALKALQKCLEERGVIDEHMMLHEWFDILNEIGVRIGYRIEGEEPPDRGAAN